VALVLAVTGVAVQDRVMDRFHLAQLNIAEPRAPLESAVMVDFVANLDRINALAEASPGFVWRLVDDDGANATGLRPFGEQTLVNLSVWTDLASLRAFVFESAHAPILKRRREWFEPLGVASMVLWWVPVGHRPSTAEAKERLERLRRHGPSAHAFTFREPFEPQRSAEAVARS